MSAHEPGFSLLELLIALAICAVLAAGIAIIVPPARAAFELTPAELDLQQRGRTAIDVIVRAIRASGSDAVAAAEYGPLSGIVPAVIPLHPQADGTFAGLKVITPRFDAAQGILEHHQSGSSGALALAAERCPAVTVLCGFVRDTTALIADGSGRFDLFTVASVDAAANLLTARRPLTPPYAAGSVLVEAEAHTFQLEPQPDGSLTLVRLTAGGAQQPIADRVSALIFVPYELDEFGVLTPLAAQSLLDGPWSAGEPDGDYDDDVFRVKRIDIELTMHAAAPSTSERTLRVAVSLRNVR
jgi:prepilin-type N-terminal cleavage/methylation domain-containing protein